MMGLIGRIEDADGAGPCVAHRGRRPSRVLIVDDLEDNRRALTRLCQMFGFRTEAAEDGAQAVAAISSRRFDLVLMDIFMPRLDGLEATRAIRALGGRQAATPIIGVMRGPDPATCQRYRALGMTDVMDKPVAPRRLAEAINAAFDAAHLAARRRRRLAIAA